jgi:hypothetical protein
LNIKYYSNKNTLWEILFTVEDVGFFKRQSQ